MEYNFWMAFFLIITVSPHVIFGETPKENTNITDEVTQAVQNGITAFTLKLNKLLQENNTRNENVLFSPINIFAALALLHLGSEGKTRDEISEVMGIPKSLQVHQVHQSIKTLLTSAQKQYETTVFQNRKFIKVNLTILNFADGIFVQNGLSLKKNYINDMKTYYDSEVIKVDFVSRGNEAINIINQYVANKTEKRISRLFTEPLSLDTRIIVASSLYFKSQWLDEFPPSYTKSDVFYTENGNITVDMMKKYGKMPYANIPSLGVETVKQSFADETISMFIVLPYENQTLNNLLKNLTSENINKIIIETETPIAAEIGVDFKLPKTTFKWSKNLNQELVRLGVQKLFSNEAENESNLKVAEVSHATDIKIMEKGTEASAVTFYRTILKIGPARHAVFHVNRPFLMFIYHHTVKSILFFGTVYNPNEQCP